MNEKECSDANKPVKQIFGVHPDVLKLGLVSFLTDLSSEMIFSVFAVFFTTVAGASTALLGLIEGLADLSASALNYVAGWLSDRTGQRKSFALAGYGFSTLAKCILLISTSIIGLGVFRVIERLGKSFRGAPRDAWLSSLAVKGKLGLAFGLHKALDKSGAVLGPLAAYGLLSWLGDGAATYRILFVVALIPAILSVICLAFIKDQPAAPKLRVNMLETWSSLSPQYKRYLLTSAIFSLGYFSFGFLLLRAHDIGFAVKDIVLLYALFNIIFVIAAPLAGKLGDQVGRPPMIMLGYLLYMLMNLGFAFASTPWHIITLFTLFGIFYAIDETQGKAFIVDLEPAQRGSALGLQSFISGLIYLPASLLAGALWLIEPASPFLFSALLALIAMIVFFICQIKAKDLKTKTL